MYLIISEKRSFAWAGFVMSWMGLLSSQYWGLAQIRFTATDRLMSYASISHCYQTSRGIASAEHTVYLASNAFVYAFVTHLNLVYSFFSYFFKWFASYLEKDEFSNRFYFL